MIDGTNCFDYGGGGATGGAWLLVCLGNLQRTRLWLRQCTRRYEGNFQVLQGGGWRDAAASGSALLVFARCKTAVRQLAESQLVSGQSPPRITRTSKYPEVQLGSPPFRATSHAHVT